MRGKEMSGVKIDCGTFEHQPVPRHPPKKTNKNSFLNHIAPHCQRNCLKTLRDLLRATMLRSNNF